MVLSLMKLFIPAERRATALEILGIVQERLAIHPDYLGSCIEQRDSASPHILYVERWKSKEALREHIRSSLYRCVLAAVELSSKPPEINFCFVLSTKGMDLIQALRGRSFETVGAS